MKKHTNFYQRYYDLKKQIGGNREKQEFEFTMRPAALTMHGITPPPAHIKRILSQVLFALDLNTRNENVFDEELEQAIARLEQSMEQEGVLTKSACAEAEQCLLPLQKAAREYEVIYAAHAHIDMNWMWGWQETVAATLSTFRTMLNLMKEYPGFTYSQSQASVYKIVEEYDPEMMEEIKARIAEGRWEVTANAWVETDKNMPDTESLIRHISVTRNYLHETWGIEPGSIKVDFSPDTFGHSRFVPTINNFANVPYYYHCRGLQDDLTLYRYRDPSGKEVLMYKEPYWYNSGINPDNGTGVFELEKRCAGLKTALIVYGVGNHGGGPTRRDIENMLEMQKWPVFPTLRFGTIQEYFEKAEAVRELLPVIDHELNAIFTGCYSTQSRIKLANRRSESGLLESECMSALAHFSVGSRFDEKQYEAAWQDTLFTHFHDILTGSCVQESREYAMGRLASAIARAQTGQAKAYEKLTAAIDTSMFEADEDIRDTGSEGAGVGYGIASYAGVPNPERGAGKTRIYTVFNGSDAERSELVELTMWDYIGDLKRVEVIDAEGTILPHQFLDQEMQTYWDHQYIRLLVQIRVPALGYAVCAVREKELTAYPTYLLEAEREELPQGMLSLENEYLKAGFDTGSGQMISLVNKENGEELLKSPAGLTLVRTQNGGMTAWRIGRYLELEPVCDTMKVTVEEGELRNSLIFEQKVMHSDVKMKISLDAGAKALQYDLCIDWKEACNAQDYIPLLSYRLPLKKEAEGLLCDVPAGTVVRKPDHIDVPALTGACAVCEGTKPALITDCKYGYRLADNVLGVTLINTAGDPDPYPERGIHAIKLLVALTDGAPRQLKHVAKSLSQPMTAVPTARHEGVFAPSASLLGFEAEHSVLTSVRMGAKDSLLLRVYEAEGSADTVKVTIPASVNRAVEKAVLTDLDGTEIRGAEVCGNQICVDLKPYELTQIQVCWKN